MAETREAPLRLLQALPGWDPREAEDAELVRLCLLDNALARREVLARAPPNR